LALVAAGVYLNLKGNDDDAKSGSAGASARASGEDGASASICLAYSSMGR
jgi:hypothetical protein